jgi:hypothetical protein
MGADRGGDRRCPPLGFSKKKDERRKYIKFEYQQLKVFKNHSSILNTIGRSVEIILSNLNVSL